MQKTAKLQWVERRTRCSYAQACERFERNRKKAIGPKRKSTRSGARRCPAVGAKRPEMPINADGQSRFRRFFKKYYSQACASLRSRFRSLAELPVGANTGRGRDQRSSQRTVAAFPFWSDRSQAWPRIGPMKKARSDPGLFVVLCCVRSVGAELEVQLGARDEEVVLVVLRRRRNRSTGAPPTGVKVPTGPLKMLSSS